MIDTLVDVCVVVPESVRDAASSRVRRRPRSMRRIARVVVGGSVSSPATMDADARGETRTGPTTHKGRSSTTRLRRLPTPKKFESHEISESIGPAPSRTIVGGVP